MGKLGIAIVGTGYWGVNYVRTFSELSRSQVVAVCDQRPERLEEIGARYPGLHLTTELDDVLGREETHAVVVCTPATSHAEVAHRCLEAGKHLLIEKPITIKASDAESLIDLAERRGLTLMVGHTFIHNPGVRKLKSYLDQGEIGRPYYLYSRRTNMGPIRRDVNALWDLAPHDISVFNYLLNAVPEWVSAVGARVLRNLREDVGFISLGYPNDIVAHIHVSWADPNKVREIVVVGSDRRIVFDDLNPLERVRVFEKGVRSIQTEASSYGEHQFQMRDGDIISPKVEVSEPLKNQCIHFLECLAKGVRPVSGGMEGLDVVRVMEAVDQSLEQKGAPVPVKPSRLATRPSVGTAQPEPDLIRAMWDTVSRATGNGLASAQKENGRS